MAGLIREITITVERRHVGILCADGVEKLGFFHKWTYDNQLKKDVALVEMADGWMEYFNTDVIRFLPIGDEIHPKELEKTYRELGILVGGKKND